MKENFQKAEPKLITFATRTNVIPQLYFILNAI